MGQIEVFVRNYEEDDSHLDTRGLKYSGFPFNKHLNGKPLPEHLHLEIERLYSEMNQQYEYFRLEMKKREQSLCNYYSNRLNQLLKDYVQDVD